MWYKNGEPGSGNAVKFNMPVLRDEGLIGENTDHIEREAYERGFEAGERAGFEMGMQRATVVLERIEAMLRGLATMRQGLEREMEAQCVELAVGIAKRILLAELQTQPGQIVEMVKEALTRIERSGRITVKLHPSLRELFARKKPELFSIHPDISFEVDSDLPQFGTAVIGPCEEVASGIDEQMKNLIKDMVDRHAGL